MESRNYERDGNLVKAFNDYADAGATYNGVSIKLNPALQKAYDIISKSRKFFTETELKQLVDSSLKLDEASPLIKTIAENAKFLPKNMIPGTKNFVEDSSEILKSFSSSGQ